MKILGSRSPLLKDTNAQNLLHTQQLVAACTVLIGQEQPFSHLVDEFTQAGVEYYMVDFLSKRITFYAPSEDNVTLPLLVKELPVPSSTLNTVKVRRNISDCVENGRTFYEFATLMTRAGVQSYSVFIAGKRIIYMGRRGTSYTEWFPEVGVVIPESGEGGLC